MKTTAAYKALKKQASTIRTESDLKSAHITISQAYSAYRISHEEWTDLRKLMLAKRAEFGFAWGKSIFHYWMKVYEIGSEFGIDGGRISKLTMKRKDEYVVNYDRGWDIKPVDADTQRAYEILLQDNN